MWTATKGLKHNQYFTLPYMAADILDAKFEGTMITLTVPLFNDEEFIGIYGVFYQLEPFFDRLMSPMITDDSSITYWVYTMSDFSQAIQTTYPSGESLPEEMVQNCNDTAIHDPPLDTDWYQINEFDGKSYLSASQFAYSQKEYFDNPQFSYNQDATASYLIIFFQDYQ